VAVDWTEKRCFASLGTCDLTPADDPSVPTVDPLPGTCTETATVSVAEDKAACGGVSALMDATVCETVVTKATDDDQEDSAGALDDVPACAYTVTPATVRAAQGRLSALSIFLCKSVLYGAFVWARRALNG
jgi:hypothetical protein